MNVIISGIALTALLGACITVALSDRSWQQPANARTHRQPRA